ncbi:MAG TPA: alpha/beta hydrolase [Gemmatimonadaceae bacterium]|jgi:pimeloyl-ACP methyl ester carboxylesterase|nr:alpha/beta hydrolase [Gemmatimonadaceae bacterium]
MKNTDTVDRRTVVGALTAASLGLVLEGVVPRVARALPPNGTIVLVHGAWADGSNWQRVINPLERQGLKVICAPIPLTTLSDDIAALQRTLERTTGPVVLVGHAYAGGVIGAIHDDRVKSLVYVAALAPAEGETVADVFYKDPKPPQSPKLAPDAHGFIWMPDDGVRNALAQNASAEEKHIAAAVQRPIAVQCIQEKAPAPAWPGKPVWFLVAEEDRMINPKTQRFMAGRMSAKVRSLRVDHSPQISAPTHVVDVIMEAARATLPQGVGA